jgi:hypothetical protein
MKKILLVGFIMFLANFISPLIAATSSGEESPIHISWIRLGDIVPEACIPSGEFKTKLVELVNGFKNACQIKGEQNGCVMTIFVPTDWFSTGFEGPQRCPEGQARTSEWECRGLMCPQT